MEGSYAPLHPPLPYFSDSFVAETQRLFSESQCTVGRAGKPSCSPKSTHDFLIHGWGAVVRRSQSGPKRWGEIEGSNPRPSCRLCQRAREGCRGEEARVVGVARRSENVRLVHFRSYSQRAKADKETEKRPTKDRGLTDRDTLHHLTSEQRERERQRTRWGRASRLQRKQNDISSKKSTQADSLMGVIRY